MIKIKDGKVYCETSHGNVRLKPRAIKAVQAAHSPNDATHHSSFRLAVTENMVPVPSKEAREEAWQKLTAMPASELKKALETSQTTPKKRITQRKSFTEFAQKSGFGPGV